MTNKEALEYAKSYLTVKGIPIRSTEAHNGACDGCKWRVNEK